MDKFNTLYGQLMQEAVGDPEPGKGWTGRLGDWIRGKKEQSRKSDERFDQGVENVRSAVLGRNPRSMTVKNRKRRKKDQARRDAAKKAAAVSPAP
jgi:hypothetical protein